MTPKRLAEIKRLLAKTFPNPSEMVSAREAAKELLAECERLAAKERDRAMAEELTAEVARLRGACNDTQTHLEIEQQEHEETKGYRQHAESQRDELRAVVEEQADEVKEADRLFCLNQRRTAVHVRLHSIERALRAALGGK